MELIFAYGAGLLTLINPCVLPVLPIVLASALSEDKRGPIALAGGLSLSFVTFGLMVATIGHSIGLTETMLTRVGASLMLAFGIILLIPTFASRFELATAGFASSADSKLFQSDLTGLKGQFLAGLLLGAVWSPCIGPTLGGAIALASQGQNLGWAAAIMIAFSMGVSTLILALGLGAKGAIRSRANALRSIASRTKPLMGGIFVTVGLMLLFNLHHAIEAWAVRNLPYWLQDLSVAL